MSLYQQYNYCATTKSNAVRTDTITTQTLPHDNKMKYIQHTKIKQASDIIIIIITREHSSSILETEI